MIGDPTYNALSGLQGLGASLGQAQGLQGVMASSQAQQQAYLGQQQAQQQAMQMQSNMFRENNEKEAEEKDLRENNPGVKAAWEQYQIMLKLSRK